MNRILAMAPVSGIVLAAALLGGCATADPPQQVAAADCKIQPLQTATTTYGKKREVTEIERREAEMQLASSQYRLRQLQSGFGPASPLEDAIRDCNK